MSKTRLIIGIIVTFVVVVFTLQNTEVVTVNFLLWRFSLSRVLLIFVLLLVGALIGWLLHGLAHYGRKHQS